MKNYLRFTKFGKFFKKTSRNELPQNWDILCGRISVVVPRSSIMDDVSSRTVTIFNINFIKFNANLTPIYEGA